MSVDKSASVGREFDLDRSRSGVRSRSMKKELRSDSTEGAATSPEEKIEESNRPDRKVDRRTLKVLLAALDMDYPELAERMGYAKGYVANVVSGATEPSDVFKQAFGELLADLLLGCSYKGVLYPAEPLRQFVAGRAAGAPDETKFYAELGLSSGGWNKRRRVTSALVDRVCCALGVHPTFIYPEFTTVEEAS